MGTKRVPGHLKKIFLLMMLGVLSFSIAPAFLTAASFAYYQWNDLILRGVHVRTVDVGGLTKNEAQHAIDQAFNHESELLLIVVPDAETSWKVSPVDFGMQVDAIGSAEEAYKFGREGNLFRDLTTMLGALKEGRVVDPELVFDRSKAEKALVSMGDKLHRDPVDAWLELSDAQVLVHPPEAGVDLDFPRTLETLSAEYQAIYFQQGWMPLFATSIQPQRSDVYQVEHDLEALLVNTPAVHAYDPVTDEHFTWIVSRDRAAEWIAVKDDGVEISLEIDPMKIQSYVDELNSFLGPERHLDKRAVVDEIFDDWVGMQDAEPLQLISYYPSQYTVQPGDNLVSIGFKVHMPYWKLQEVNPNLSAQRISAGQTLIVPPRDDLLTLPVVPGKRIVISIADQRMWVYENGDMLWDFIVSTGIPDSPTMPGIFQISSHYENAYASIWDLYMPHFMGIYDAVPGLTNGIHGLPVLSNGRRLWAEVLGSPASYGCIILNLEAAEQLYEWADEGVVVEIKE
ncbi:MAG: L,D-transpeptidase family protein [Anaerolineales bacterium]|jgi:lipoprotein-anchoring transpeptidase ErfK/SrfK